MSFYYYLPIVEVFEKTLAAGSSLETFSLNHAITIVYLGEDFVVRKILKLETDKAETICIEITVGKKK